MEEKLMFKADAKLIVDMVFDNKLFIDRITRDDMNTFEELIEFLLSSRYSGYVRTNKFMARIEANKKAPDVEGKEFYELMQRYRVAPMENQGAVTKAFEEIKKWILNEKL